MPDIRFQYTVSVNEDGSVLIDPTIPEDKKDVISREATAIDIIDASRKLVADLERQITLDTINSAISSLSPAPEPTVPETVKEALKERGITPEA